MVAIPLPEDMLAMREEAQTTDGELMRIVRTIRERPDLDVFRFVISKHANGDTIRLKLANAGWKIVPSNDKDTIVFTWP